MNTDAGVRKGEERLPWLRGWDPANPDLASGRGLYIGPPSSLSPSLSRQLPLRGGTGREAGRKDEGAKEKENDRAW